jgi:hypothetical protein
LTLSIDITAGRDMISLGEQEVGSSMTYSISASSIYSILYQVCVKEVHIMVDISFPIEISARVHCGKGVKYEEVNPIPTTG